MGSNRKRCLVLPDAGKVELNTPALGWVCRHRAGADELWLNRTNMRIINILIAVDNHPYRRIAIVCIYLPDPSM